MSASDQSWIGPGGPSAQERANARAVFAGIALAWLLVVAWGMLSEPWRVGTARDDWDYFFHLHEAARISLLGYGQFPWWNVWSCGGVPLFANPQVGVLSVNMPLVALFGTVPGLKVAVLLHLIVGFEGMRRLIRQHVAGPFDAFGAAAFVGGGALAMHTAIGHFSALTVCYLPWLLLFARRLPDGDRHGWLFGGAMGLMALEAVHYMTIGAAVIAAALAAGLLVTADGRRWRVARRIALAFGVFLALAGFRLALSAQFVQDYSLTSGEHVVSLDGRLPDAFLSRVTYLWQESGAPYHGWWEYAGYVGVPLIALFALSLMGAVRYWHMGAALCVLATVGAGAAWSPSTWLSRAPLLGALRVLTRWRLPAALFIAIGAGWTADRLYGRAQRKWLRTALVAACAVALLDVLLVSRRTFAQALEGPVLPPQEATAAAFRHVPPAPAEDPALRLMYPATRRNQGVIEGYEPLLGYDRLRPNAVEVRPEGGGLARLIGDGEALEPAEWSPNRVVFEGVPGPARVNLAPGSYWRVNGRAPFAAMRVTEPTQPFVALPDESGRIELTIVPPGWQMGVALSLAGIALAAGAATAGLLVGREADERAKTAAPAPAKRIR